MHNGGGVRAHDAAPQGEPSATSPQQMTTTINAARLGRPGAIDQWIQARQNITCERLAICMHVASKARTSFAGILPPIDLNKLDMTPAQRAECERAFAKLNTQSLAETMDQLLRQEEAPMKANDATANRKQYDWTFGLTADEVAKITASAKRANKVTERAVRNAVSRASGAGKRR